MIAAGLALQGALNARLRAGAPSLGQRVHDAPPQGVAFPWLSLGETQTLDDGAGCVDAWEVYATLHLWSRGEGVREAKSCAGEIEEALRDWTPDLTGAGLRCVDLQHRETRVLRDPDGVTTHAVITLRALIDAL